MIKEEIFSHFDLNETQIRKIEFFVSKIIDHNKHTNLIGRSTVENIWDRHVLDCLQLSNYIGDKKLKIFDLGTGAGLPGILLSILDYKNVLMVDSVKKKTDFVKLIIKDLSLNTKILNKRIEKVVTLKQDIIVSRALAPLNSLLTYALLHSNKKTTLLFLKGRSVNSEINTAMKNFIFDLKITKSISNGEGHILELKNIKKKND